MRKLLSLQPVLVVMLVLGVFVVVDPVLAFDTGSGTEFQSVYDKVVGWVTGIPGIIAAIVFGVVGLLRAFQTGQMLWFFAGILFAVVLLLLPSIAGGLGFVY